MALTAAWLGKESRLTSLSRGRIIWKDWLC
jgi:hypothetical protein